MPRSSACRIPLITWLRMRGKVEPTWMSTISTMLAENDCEGGVGTGMESEYAPEMVMPREYATEGKIVFCKCGVDITNVCL